MKNFKSFGAVLAMTIGVAGAGVAGAVSWSNPSVGTGSSTGTYSALMRDMNRTCGAGLWREQSSGGAIENVNLLLSGKVDMGFVQFDVMRARLQLDGDSGVSGLRTLLPLHREEVHLFTKKGSNYTTAQALTGKRVGAWGGGVFTTRLISQNAGLRYEVVKFDSRDETFAALTDGRIDAVLAVVGQPGGWVADLKDVQLATVPMRGTMKETYRPATLRYPALSAKPVQTVSVQSMLMVNPQVQGFDTVGALKVQSCVQQKLAALRADPQAHPKWKDINMSLSLSPWTVLKK